MKDMNLDAEMYCKMMKDNLKPALQKLRVEVWDEANGTDDYDLDIQHDGAPGHRAAGVERYLDQLFKSVRGRFVRQPAKSPCCNMLDMAVFHSLAAKVAQYDYRTKDQLVSAVHQAWAELEPETLEMQWACKCVVMRLFVDLKGRSFRMTHAAKLRNARRQGGRAGLWAAVDAFTAGPQAQAH